MKLFVLKVEIHHSADCVDKDHFYYLGLEAAKRFAKRQYYIDSWVRIDSNGNLQASTTDDGTPVTCTIYLEETMD